MTQQETFDRTIYKADRSLLVIGKSGLALLAHMIKHETVTEEELDNAYFWRVEPNMLGGKFDATIHAAIHDGRILRFTPDAEHKCFIARFRNTDKDGTGDQEVRASLEFLSAYFYYNDVGGIAMIRDVYELHHSSRLQAFKITSGEGDQCLTALTLGEFTSCLWKSGLVCTLGMSLHSCHPLVAQHKQIFDAPIREYLESSNFQTRDSDDPWCLE